MEGELNYDELSNFGKKVYDMVVDYKNNISKDVSKEKKNEECLKILAILKTMYKEMEEDKNHVLMSLELKNFFVNENYCYV